MHGDPGDVLTPLLNLTGVNSGSQLHSKPFGLPDHRPRAADRPRRSIEGREDAVPGGLHQPTAVALELAAGETLELLKQRAPPPIAEPGGC